MKAFSAFQDFIGGNQTLAVWIIVFALSGIAVATFRGFFRARKIQPNRFRWEIFRKEIFFGTINVAISSVGISAVTAWLTKHSFITYNESPASWWVIALEFALYFFAFDTYFYWLHRWMHQKSVYKWIHKIHHYSTAPNPLTTLSVSPIESFINGGFVPLFLAVLTVHSETLKFITPCNIIMGFYVHLGYEFLPRWWNKSWATKWFITTTFHDQHHKYFNFNFGGYTPIWDFICGTVRPRYLTDFDQITSRRSSKPAAPAAASPEA